MSKKWVIFFLLVAVLVGSIGCASKTPQQSLESYVKSWQTQNFAEMYKSLSQESKTKISQDQFVKRYKDIYEGIGLKSIEIKPQIPDKITKDKEGKVAIPVKVQMDTLAGKIDLPFVVNLVYEKHDKEKDWYIVWNSKLIFPQLDEKDKVRVQRVKAKRGEIKDKQGHGLAINGQVASIGIVPEKLGNKEAAKAALVKDLGITANQVDNKLNQPWVKPSFFVPIARVPEDNKSKYSDLANIPGVFIKDEEARVYPYKDVTAHLTGYIGQISAEELTKLKEQGYSSDDLIGKAGLEQAYEKRLRGEDGGIIYVEDPSGNKKSTIAKKEVKNGEDIQLTIDIDLQIELSKQLQAEKGTAVATNPKTGEILALVSAPSYDPNQFVLGMTDSQWKSLNDQNLKPMLARFAQSYAPGSTFKVVTAGIGLKTGKLNPDEKVSISGLQWQKDSSWGTYRVTRVADSGGPVDLTRAFINSDNIYFAQAALKIGAQSFMQEAKAFGLGEQMPFPLNLQQSQLAGKEGINSEARLADTGFGQGQVLMNPVHLAMIYAGLVNSGNIVKPTLEFKQSAQAEVWKEGAFTTDAANRIFNDLVQVVVQGTARNPVVATPMAGKTGTAELKTSLTDPNPKENGWFVAVNRDNPRLLILMMIEDVKDRGGSHYVVPKVKNVLNQAISK